MGAFSASRRSAAPPTWSIWPCVSQIFSTVTPVCLIAARIFGTSPPGSITTAFLVASHQMMVQFCSNGVTGTMTAPAFALVSVSCVMGPECPFLAARQGKDLHGIPLRNRLECLHGAACPPDQPRACAGPPSVRDRAGDRARHRAAAPLARLCIAQRTAAALG